MLTGTTIGETEATKEEIVKKAVDMLNSAIRLLSIQEMIQPSTAEEDYAQFTKMEASRLFANALLDVNIVLTKDGYTPKSDTEGGIN